MKLGELITYSFEKNVGAGDRAFRVGSGAALAVAGVYFGAPLWGAIALGVLGVAWMLTGIVSRCGMYYLLGYSTCPVSGRPRPSSRA